MHGKDSSMIYTRIIDFRGLTHLPNDRGSLPLRNCCSPVVHTGFGHIFPEEERLCPGEGAAYARKGMVDRVCRSVEAAVS